MGKSIYMYLVNFLDLPYTFVSKSNFKMECGEYIYNLINIKVHLRIIIHCLYWCNYRNYFFFSTVNIIKSFVQLTLFYNFFPFTENSFKKRCIDTKKNKLLLNHYIIFLAVILTVMNLRSWQGRVMKILTMVLWMMEKMMKR